MAPQRHATSSFLVSGETLDPLVFFGIVTQPISPSLLALNLSTKLFSVHWLPHGMALENEPGCLNWILPEAATVDHRSSGMVLGQCLAVLLLPHQRQWSVSLQRSLRD